MELAVIVAYQIVIMFILIGIGIIVLKKGIVTIESTKNYSNFLLMIVTPALIINAYQRELVKEQLEGLIFSFILAIIFHILSIIVVKLIIRKRKSTDYKVEQMGAIYSNCGFMGFPVLSALLGQDGMLYGTAFVGVFNIFLWTNGISLLSNDTKLSIKKIFLNPGVIGVIVGLILYFTQIKLPSVIGESIGYIASLNTPLAMIITGAFLANVDMKATLKNINIYKSVLLRILILPLMMLILIKITNFENWISGGYQVALSHILSCSCPAASSTILLVTKMNLNSEHGAELVAISTLLCVITIPILTIIFNVL